MSLESPAVPGTSDPETRIWVLLAPGAPLAPAAAAEKLSGVAGQVAPLWKSAATPCAWDHAVHQVNTAELRLPATVLRDGAERLESGLSALPARPDVRTVRVDVSPDPPPAANPAIPRVRVGSWHIADLGKSHGLFQRWHLWGGPDAARDETLRRLHRTSVVEALLLRHRAEVESYAAEIGNDLQFIDRAINKVLRFRIEGQDRPALIAQLETNVKDLSSNYAKLNRNAGIYRDAVLEEERLVHLLRRAIDELGPAAPEGGSEIVFCRRVDHAEEGLDGSRRRERELLACLQSAQTAIATLGMNIELLRSSELVELQKHTGEMLKRGVELQNAAEVIEFIVLFTYSLHAWEMILGEPAFHAIPWYQRLLASLTFSGCLVASAHPLIEWRKHGHFPKWARWTLLAAGIALATMFLTPVLYAPGEHAPATGNAPAHAPANAPTNAPDGSNGGGH